MFCQIIHSVKQWRAGLSTANSFLCLDNIDDTQCLMQHSGQKKKQSINVFIEKIYGIIVDTQKSCYGALVCFLGCLESDWSGTINFFHIIIQPFYDNTFYILYDFWTEVEIRYSSTVFRISLSRNGSFITWIKYTNASSTAGGKWDFSRKQSTIEAIVGANSLLKDLTSHFVNESTL